MHLRAVCLRGGELGSLSTIPFRSLTEDWSRESTYEDARAASWPFYWVMKTKEKQRKVKSPKAAQWCSQGVAGKMVLVEWQGLKPECFRERREDNMCEQFSQKAWFWRGGEKEGFHPKVMGLEQCFSNWDGWKCSLSLRPESINKHTLCPLDAHENGFRISVPLVIFVFTINNQVAARQKSFKATFWTGIPWMA